MEGNFYWHLLGMQRKEKTDRRKRKKSCSDPLVIALKSKCGFTGYAKSEIIGKLNTCMSSQNMNYLQLQSNISICWQKHTVDFGCSFVWWTNREWVAGCVSRSELISFKQFLTLCFLYSSHQGQNRETGTVTQTESHLLPLGPARWDLQ